ncbi:MAG: ribosome biogenesis GTP-binding protein YihA/YsxC [Anaerotignum propionicum]|uniref:ribosome biogenesis GTP-binding protein YihA/YsxC n=1 Tax=Anaerotignum propionicum TaxID=28446 RepID=UPI002B2006A4|nr:ribosome biogenesis GTP-binding protein YihA/YsxC [Anaerotignum propionicum]MEA5056936.1 ribosome biogenesis GTP-binding protein YihA/YsxC [Anaerotignum propionicum]
MEVRETSLAAIGTNFSHYPVDGRMEIAFAGKSNVGKSTLINAMLGRRALARTSSQPGKTRTINFYDVNGQMYIVDLPGYGYAKAPKTEIEKWGKMIEEYLGKREELKAIILLLDLRHEPGKNDVMMYEWLKHYGYDIIIAATKSDKLNRSQIPKQLSVIRKALNLGPEDVLIPFSGEKKTGVDELWAVIEKFLENDSENPQ